MSTRFWEDFVKGDVAEYGPRQLTRDEIIAFATEFDPQPIHLDDEAASTSMLGGLAASGWHMCGIAMRMIVDNFLLDAHSMGAPGIDELRWIAPVHPDDGITLRATVLDTRASRSRPEMGFASCRFDLINQRGATVMTMTSSLMLARRPAGALA